MHISSSLEGALELLASPDFDSRVESVFVIGGGQVGAIEQPRRAPVLGRCWGQLSAEWLLLFLPRPASPFLPCPACSAPCLAPLPPACLPAPCLAPLPACPLPPEQVYKECMESPLLSAIHLTQVECEAVCDTFMPAVDTTKFKLWSAGAPRKEGDTRYSFLCYTRAGQEGLPALPPAVASRHEELQVGSAPEGIGWGGGAAAGLAQARPRHISNQHCLPAHQATTHIVLPAVTACLYRLPACAVPGDD